MQDLKSKIREASEPHEQSVVLDALAWFVVEQLSEDR
jgi:hypothetical protein